MKLTYLRAIKDCIKTSPVICTLLIILFIMSFAGSFQVIVMAKLIESSQSFLAGEGADEIWSYFALMCAIVIFSSIPLITIMALNNVFLQKTSRSFEQRLFKKIQSIPQIMLEDSKHFEKYKLASSAVEVKDGTSSMNGIVYVTITFLESIISTSISIAILVSFSPKLLIFAVLSTPLSMIISIFSENARKKMRHTQAQKTRETDYFWGLFCKKESIKEMRIFGSSNFFRNKWFTKRDEMLDEELTIQSRLLLLSNGGDIIKNLFYGLNVALAIVLTIRGEISIGEFTACLGLFATLQGNLVSFMYNIEYFFESLHLAEDYYAFIDLDEQVNGTKKFGIFKNDIELNNVSFRYPNTTDYALKNINLKINKGEHIVIVGENGSGKTTLSKLITACYSPECGDITIDGSDITSLNKKDYLRNFSVVSQNFVRYNMTFRENVGISDVAHIGDTGSIEKAVKISGLSETCDTIGGIDVELGREFGGCELSGGQWQKLAIARGIFRDAPIIILDEPTAALDPLIEYEILNDFVNMTKNKTSVIISHRIGICISADRIIVMKDGEIVEQGTHHELVEQGGEYTRMWSSQAKWLTSI